MPNKTHIAYATLVVAVANDFVWSIKARRAARKLIEINNSLADENASLVEENASLEDSVAHAHYMVTYLSQVLDAHDIALSEFDLIALNNPS